MLYSIANMGSCVRIFERTSAPAQRDVQRTIRDELSRISRGARPADDWLMSVELFWRGFWCATVPHENKPGCLPLAAHHGATTTVFIILSCFDSLLAQPP